MLATCIHNNLYPVLEKITRLPRTVVVWQTIPPVPVPKQGGGGVRKRKNIRNYYMVSAMNYFTTRTLAPLDIAVIQTSVIALPWSENLGAQRSHLMSTIDKNVEVLPPGQVVTNSLVYHACQGFL